MTRRVDTASGSVYELDSENKSIRRLCGVKDPTPRQGKDGEWKKYESINEPVLNRSMMIVWWIENEDGLMVLKTTITSPVVNIKEVN